MCVSEHDPPFPPIFRGFATAHERHGAIHTYSRQWLAFKDPFQGESSKGNFIYFCATCFLTLQQAPGLWPLNLFNLKKFLLDIHNPQGKDHLVSLIYYQSIFSYCRLSKPRSLKKLKLVVATNFFHWKVLSRRSQFLPGMLHFRPSTDLHLISSKHTRHQYTMAGILPDTSSTKAAKRRQNVLDMLVPKSTTSAVPDLARILCHSNGLLKYNIHMKIYRVVPMYRYILFHGARLIVHTNS